MIHTPIYSTVACNLDKHILLSILPLLAQGEIEGLEWSFDAIYDRSVIPDWFYELLEVYGNEGRLIGHGIYFSLFSGAWKTEQQRWLEHLQFMSDRFKMDHISEHFGFTTGEDFHKGAPLSIPLTDTTLRIGVDRLLRISEACQRPIGLENLAFAYRKEDVQMQGAFLDALLGKVNGFLILDLHNIYCQMHNFSVSAEEILSYYPLDRVREIHISGGSWSASAVNEYRDIRRDTHDDAVPQEVFDLLSMVIPQCRHLKFVVLEQMGSALVKQESRETFRSDFLTMKKIVKRYGTTNGEGDNDFIYRGIYPSDTPAVDNTLAHQQEQLSQILEAANDYHEAKKLLLASSLHPSSWYVDQWDDAMLDTAIQIAQKWKNGFTS